MTAERPGPPPGPGPSETAPTKKLLGNQLTASTDNPRRHKFHVELHHRTARGADVLAVAEHRQRRLATVAEADR